MQPNTLDICSTAKYPAKALSNFTARKFIFDEVECASLEGFLQSLKFDKFHVQVEVCKLIGINAKNRGKDRNSQWKIKGGIWWHNEFYKRRSDEYQRLLDRVFLAVARQCKDFRQALIDTGDLILVHRIGKSSELDTVLTQNELCSRLMKIRTLIKKNVDLETVKRL
jgi:predicted NAD-dependent protein-ADP-ribosyltransferase YbiA (DUF1768 family)